MATPEHDVERGIPEIQPVAAPLARPTPTPVQASELTQVPAVAQAEQQHGHGMISRGISWISSRPLSALHSPQLQPQPNPYTAAASTMSFDPNSALQRYRNHLGIHNTEDLTMHRTAANLGIFPRVVASEKAAHRQYQIFSCLINGALGLQIIFAAALTALGAGNGPRSAVTAFGAMNTILAGLLTFLKGSGLPNRLKYYENEWIKVREYIEQRERAFAHVTAMDHELNLFEEINIIERMYETVRQDIEANTPDSYISMSRHQAIAGGANAKPGLARTISMYSNNNNTMSHGQPQQVPQMQQTNSDLHRFSNYLPASLQQGIDARLHQSQTMLNNTLSDGRAYTNSQVNQAQSSLDDSKAKLQNHVQIQVNEVQAQADAQIRSIQEQADARLKEVHEQIRQGEEKAKTLENKVVSTTEKAAEKVLGFIHARKEKEKE